MKRILCLGSMVALFAAVFGDPALSILNDEQNAVLSRLYNNNGPVCACSLGKGQKPVLIEGCSVARKKTLVKKPRKERVTEAVSTHVHQIQPYWVLFDDIQYWPNGSIIYPDGHIKYGQQVDPKIGAKVRVDGKRVLLKARPDLGPLSFSETEHLQEHDDDQE